MLVSALAVVLTAILVPLAAIAVLFLGRRR